MRYIIIFWEFDEQTGRFYLLEYLKLFQFYNKFILEKKLFLFLVNKMKFIKKDFK
jgi:hypothetical protein